MFTRQATSAFASSSSTYARASNHARQSLRTANPRNARKTSETTRRCYASLARWMRTSDHAEPSSRAVLGMDSRRPSLEGQHEAWSWNGRQSRGLHSTPVSRHGDITRPAPGTGIKLHFRDSKNHLIKTVEANEGDSILEIAHEHDIDLEGACEGSVACSTCHVILSPEHYDMLEEPDDDENDMLDMAFGLTDTSRLGCQVHMKKEIDGITVTLPSATRNMYVDGAKPTPH